MPRELIALAHTQQSLVHTPDRALRRREKKKKCSSRCKFIVAKAAAAAAEFGCVTQTNTRRACAKTMNEREHTHEIMLKEMKKTEMKLMVRRAGAAHALVSALAHTA
jgi:hypothetical protein